MARSEDRAELGDLIATPMRERGVRDGRRYWRIRDRDRRTVASGWWTRDELDGALALALTQPRTRRSRSAGGDTVADLLGLWRTAQVKREESGEIAARTLEIYRNCVRGWLATGLASVLATKLSRAAVQDQATAWLAAGAVAPRTVDLHIRILQAAVAWGSDRGHCPELDLSLPPYARDDEHVYSGRVPTRAELAAVLEVLPAGPRRDAIEILGLTGARVGEVAALRVMDVDLVARTLRLCGRDEGRGRRGKTKARLFPLRGRLLELCERLVCEARDRTREVVGAARAAGGPCPDCADHGPSVQEPGLAVPGRAESSQRRHPTGGVAANLLDLPASAVQVVNVTLTRACKAAGVDAVTPHGIRRLVVEELLEAANGNAKRVSQLTGHSVMVLLRHYVRPTADQLGSLVEVAQLGVETVDNVRPMRRPGGE